MLATMSTTRRACATWCARNTRAPPWAATAVAASVRDPPGVHGHPQFGEATPDGGAERHHPPRLLVGIHRLAVGPGPYAADVDDVRAVGHGTRHRRHRRLGRERRPLVEERVPGA